MAESVQSVQKCALRDVPCACASVVALWRAVCFVPRNLHYGAVVLSSFYLCYTSYFVLLVIAPFFRQKGATNSQVEVEPSSAQSNAV